MLNQHTKAYWCVVNDSNIWLKDGKLPNGSAIEFNLPFEQAICIGNHNSEPVMWLNDELVNQELAYTGLRELLEYPQSDFFVV